MNAITAPKGGTVKEIRVDDGTPVEFGQTLLRHRLACSKKSSSPIAAKSRFASSAPARRWASPPWRSIPPPTADAMHVRLADESVCIGPPAAAQSYLNIPAIIAACEITGAEAIHPGYGFLSENAKFADIVEEHGLTFIGPTRRTYPHDGRQDHRQADGEGAGHSHRAGLGRRSQRRGCGQHGRRDRLSGADQGHRRRRRPRHEGGARMRANCPSRCPRRAPKPRPPSATTPSIWRNISRSRAISKSRSWPTATARSCIWANATARCSAATRKCGKKPAARPSTPRNATRSAASAPRRSASWAIWAPAPSNSSTRTAASISSR